MRCGSGLLHSTRPDTRVERALFGARSVSEGGFSPLAYASGSETSQSPLQGLAVGRCLTYDGPRRPAAPGRRRLMLRARRLGLPGLLLALAFAGLLPAGAG